jgi:hypothetical protein
MIFFDGNKMQIDREKYRHWEDSRRVKHFDQLPIDSEVVKQIIKMFQKKYNTRKIISRLHRYYWMNCENISEFENSLKTKNNIEIEKIIF